MGLVVDFVLLLFFEDGLVDSEVTVESADRYLFGASSSQFLFSVDSVQFL